MCDRLLLYNPSASGIFPPQRGTAWVISASDSLLYAACLFEPLALKDASGRRETGGRMAKWRLCGRKSQAKLGYFILSY